MNGETGGNERDLRQLRRDLQMTLAAWASLNSRPENKNSDFETMKVIFEKILFRRKLRIINNDTVKLELNRLLNEFVWGKKFDDLT
jgi:hypothetical protein